MTFVIVDPGADHLGSLDRMLSLIEVAKWAGADAIKPQLYRAESLYIDGIRVEEQYGQEDLKSIVSRYELPLEWLPILKAKCDAVGIEFMCSAFSKDLYDAVDPFVRRHKIASLEAGDLDLVDYVVAFGKPVIISTGAATYAETERLWLNTPPGTALLQCATAYPAPIEEADLAAIAVDDLLNGFSDHTRSLISGAIAVACGAKVVEKHITLGDAEAKQQPDFGHSLDGYAMKEYISNIRDAELLLGSSKKRIRPSEEALVGLRRKEGKLRGAA